MSESQDFLVELGTEELPPRALLPLSLAFASGLRGGLESASLSFGDILVYATPRRLAVVVKALALRQPDKDVERRGPPVRVAFDADGKATKAAVKFAQGCGVALDNLEREKTPKGEWLLYRATETGQRTRDLLPEIITQSLDALPIPRRMRWGASDAQFVRPVHWLVMLLGNDVVPTTVLDTDAGRVSRGHRFMAPGEIVLQHPDDYASALEHKGKVIADFARRRQIIEQAVIAAASALGGKAVYDSELLDEVTALVEWPVAVTGHFEKQYLELPPEVLISTLQGHQRYFPVRDAAGNLINAFITISNIESREPAMVRAGNERVVRPRLADAAFFFDNDRRTPLASRVDALGNVVFQKALGTLKDKTQRVRHLANVIATQSGADATLAVRAALLSKADLLTDMVGEFPELQGTMGRYYATHDGEPDEVAAALEQQYQPRFAGAPLPESATGRVLSLADKIDTIVGIFGIGKPPSGTRDPFGLRRQALGVLRMLIEDKVDLDVRQLITVAAEQLPIKGDSDALVSQVYDYMMERLRAWYLDGDQEGFSAGMFDAVLARQPARPLDFHRRMEAVREFVSLEEAASLAAANKRIANILRTAKDRIPDTPDAALLTIEAEKNLFAQLDALEASVQALLNEASYREALIMLASLRAPVDQFFDDVMVMDENPALRVNRLALLDRLRRLFLHTADLSRLQ